MGEPVFPVDYLAYCDESKYLQTRFRAVSCVSVTSEARAEVESALHTILDEASKKDMGFEDLRTAANCMVAARMMRCVVEFAATGRLQVRTLIWNAYDTRHGPGTDELRNMERMYVHLLRDVLGRRWPKRAWEVRPDEHTAVRWNGMARILESAASKTAGRPIEVRHLEQQSSACEPLVQVADLYAGLMSHYAHNGAALGLILELPQDQQTKALSFRQEPLKSGSDRERFKLLPHVIALHEENGIPARLGPRGLIIGDGVASPVFNWLYEPQHSRDKAPRRGDDTVVAAHFDECSEPGCTETVELPFQVEDPLCKRHYYERNPDKVERNAELEERREAERTYRSGSHYCDGNSCTYIGTPSPEDLAKANYIGRRPKCPDCGAWSLISMLPQSENASTDDQVRDFELRHDDRWKGRDY